MLNVREIFLVARYERKMQSREFVYWILVFLILAVMFVFNMTGYLPWGNSYNSHFDVGLPTAIPYSNAYLLCVLQAFAMVFLAGDFCWRESKLSTNESLQVRPVSNISYVLGKGLAEVELFFGLDVFLLVAVSVFQILGTESTFDPWHPLFYFLTLTLPSLFFMAALTVFVKLLTRTRVLSLLLLLLFFVGSCLWLSRVAGGVFDFLSTSVPNSFSSMVGHPAQGSYLLHRFFWVALGCAFLFWGVRCYPRVSESFRWGRGLPVACLSVALLALALHVYPFWRERQARERYRAAYRLHDGSAKLNTSRHAIAFRQDGSSYSARSEMVVVNRNREGMDTLLFYLNPGLEVSRLTVGGREMPVDRREQVIRVFSRLEAGDSARVVLEYGGRPERGICYTDIPDEEYYAFTAYSVQNFGREYFFLGTDFTLLTPESIWYPTTLPVVNLTSPWSSRREFTRYELKVENPDERTVLSQGELRREGNTVYFRPDHPLSGITLVAGDLVREDLDKEKTVSFYYAPHAEACRGLFPASGELKEKAAMEIKNRYYRVLQSRSARVEVPLSFHVFERAWQEGTDYVHPEMSFLPELRLKAFDFEKMLLEEKRKREERLKQRPGAIASYRIEELSVENLWVDELAFYFSRICFTSECSFDSWFSLLYDNLVYINAKNRSKQYSNKFPGGTLFVSSDKYPLMDFVFKNMLELKVDYMGSHRDLKDWEALEVLARESLATIFASDQYDGELKKRILAHKVEQLQFFLLHAIPADSIQALSEEFQQRYPYQEVAFERFSEEVATRFGVDLDALMDKWYHEKGLPVYAVRDVKIEKVYKKGSLQRIVNNVSFKVWNRGDVEGVVLVYRSGWTRDRKPDNRILKSLVVPPHSGYEVAVNDMSDYGNITVLLGFSMNLPNVCTGSGMTRDVVDPFVRKIDSAAFFSPNEIVVDNEDEGFMITEERKRLLAKTKTERYSTTGGQSSWGWTQVIEQSAYGEVVKSTYSKASGSAKSKVEWNATIKEAGKYDLFVHRPRLSTVGINNFRWQEAPEVKYSFLHDNAEDKILLRTERFQTKVTLQKAGEAEEEVRQREGVSIFEGWLFVGQYELSPGKVKLVLNDEGLSLGQILFADAVKWVKVE